MIPGLDGWLTDLMEGHPPEPRQYELRCHPDVLPGVARGVGPARRRILAVTSGADRRAPVRLGRDHRRDAPGFGRLGTARGRRGHQVRTARDQGGSVTVPPREVLAAYTRQAIEIHDERDSPHSFHTLHWDGEKLACRTYACIMPDISPAQYPKVMAGIAAEQREKAPDDPAYAYLLQIESFGMTEPGPDAGEAERDRYHRARLGRTFHEQPDAVEAAVAWCADIHGRLWTAGKTRNRPGEITEHFYPPHAPRRPGGQFIDALLAVAYATGTADYGLPGPHSAGAN